MHSFCFVFLHGLVTRDFVSTAFWSAIFARFALRNFVRTEIRTSIGMMVESIGFPNETSGKRKSLMLGVVFVEKAEYSQWRIWYNDCGHALGEIKQYY